MPFSPLLKSCRLPAAISTALLCVTTTSAQPIVSNLLQLNGNNGFRVDGANSEDRYGTGAISGGDVNGDGIHDFAAGSSFIVNNDNGEGRTYVIFGNSSGLPLSTSVADLDGTNGFAINGNIADSFFGSDIKMDGDINGDGLADIVIGDFIATASGTNSGRAAVIFGSDQDFPASISLNDLDGSNGFLITGEFPYDLASYSFDYIGDVNGDGMDDLLIGSPFSDPNATRSGRDHIIFGQQTGFPAVFNLGVLDGSNGFTLDGLNAFDRIGSASAGGADINADGISDIIIGSDQANSNAGLCYVVFGRADNSWPLHVQLSQLNGSDGFRIDPDDASSRMCNTVASAEDINGDGIGEFIIGAPGLQPNGPSSGGAYVLLGSSSPFPAVLNVSSLDGTNGFRIDGPTGATAVGTSFSAGDLNNDQIADLVIGAPLYNSNTGRVHIIFGGSTSFPAVLPIESLDESNSFTISGIREFDVTGASVSAAGDVNNDGIRDLVISATGTDNTAELSGSTYTVYGTDVLFDDGLEAAL